MRGSYWGYAPHIFGFGWGMAIFAALVLAALVVAIILFVRKRNPDIKRNNEAKEKAFAILAERYARGEIDAETLKAMKGEIEKTL
jgi:uncharacterized membrane protein